MCPGHPYIWATLPRAHNNNITFLWSVISAKNSASSRGAFPIEGGQQRALLAKKAVKQRALLVKRAVKT